MNYNKNYDPNDIVGTQIGRWTVLKAVPAPEHLKNKEQCYLCECSCKDKTQKIVTRQRLRHNKSLSCGCLRKERKFQSDLKRTNEKVIGHKFGRLTPIEFAYVERNSTYYTCKCDCGNICNANSSSLITGSKQSCGCYKSDLLAKFNKETKKLYNDYKFMEDFVVGFSTDGRPFVFDKEDFDLVKNHCWHFNNHGYVCTNIDGKYIQMHRLILGLSSFNEDSVIVDHIHRIRYDNRKSVLRITDPSGNSKNHNISKNNTSGATGVRFDEKLGKWGAYIGVNYETIGLGYYSNLSDAIKARKDGEDKYFKEYSCDNSDKFVKEEINRLEEIINGI